jgi:hypothetical protein
LAADVVTALQAGYKWTENGDEYPLTTPIRIPAWLDYTPEFVPPPESKPKSSEPPIWSQPYPPGWKALAYFLPKNYQWKTYKVNKNDNHATRIYALVPDGYDLDRDENGNLKRDRTGHYVPVESKDPAPHLAYGTRVKGSSTVVDIRSVDRKDVGRCIAGKGIPSGTTIMAVDVEKATARMSDSADDDSTAIISVGDADQFSYADEVVSDVWPVWQDYFYVELRKGEVGGVAAERVCHSQSDKIDPPNDVICGYFKIGNFLQIMQRLADMACPYVDKDAIATNCSQSIFGIGTSVPAWAENSAPYRRLTGLHKLQTESVWVPAHNPAWDTKTKLAERDRKTFFTLYKLYQMSLVDTSKLVTGTTPITISK